MATRKSTIYLAQFPFLEGVGRKLRPVIAVSEPHGPHAAVIVVPISSREELAGVDVVLADWQVAGLAKQSVARVHRLTAMLQTDLLEDLGFVSATDKRKIEAAMRKLLKL